MEYTDFNGILDAPVLRALVDATGRKLCFEGVAISGGCEALANTRLACAAPALLEALIDLTERHAAQNADDPEYLAVALAPARAAIAQASEEAK